MCEDDKILKCDEKEYVKTTLDITQPKGKKWKKKKEGSYPFIWSTIKNAWLLRESQEYINGDSSKLHLVDFYSWVSVSFFYSLFIFIFIFISRSFYCVTKKFGWNLSPLNQVLLRLNDPNTFVLSFLLFWFVSSWFFCLEMPGVLKKKTHTMTQTKLCPERLTFISSFHFIRWSPVCVCGIL